MAIAPCTRKPAELKKEHGEYIVQSGKSRAHIAPGKNGKNSSSERITDFSAKSM
jgi:hypothetical protein